MTHIFDGLSVSGGSCSVSLDNHSGTLYMIANTDGIIDLESLKSGDITEDQWLRTTVALQDGRPSDFFSGSVSLDGMENTQTEIPLSLKRGAASGQQARLKSTESPSAALRNQDSCFRCQASSLRMM